MDILFSDSKIVVCCKPVGVDSEHGVPELLQAQLGGAFFPVHRLDLNVGGVMVYGRTKAAAAMLSQLIREGNMIKEYVALVHGAVPPEGDWEDLLFKDARRNKVFVVDRMRSGVKSARLEFTRLREGENSLVRIRLHTGRAHQIRVQFASRGFPLVGDHKYGARDSISAPMLFSCSITFDYEGSRRCFQLMPAWAKSVSQAD